MIKQSFYDRIFEMADRYYGVPFASQVRELIEGHNMKIAENRKPKTEN